jgi:hypothetical protein
VVSSFIHDDPAKSLHPVLLDRNEFIFLGVAGKLRDCRSYRVSVRHGNRVQFLFQMIKEVVVTGRYVGALWWRQLPLEFLRALRIVGGCVVQMHLLMFQRLSRRS